MKTVSYVLSSIRLALVCVGLVYLFTYGATTALGATTATPSEQGGSLLEAQAVEWCNAATSEALEAVKGIGPTIAARIIAARDKGEFKRFSDVLAIKGIGPTIGKRILSHVKAIDYEGGSK